MNQDEFRNELKQRLRFEKHRNNIKDPVRKKCMDESLDHAIVIVTETLVDPKPRKKRILCPDCTPRGTDT